MKKFFTLLYKKIFLVGLLFTSFLTIQAQKIPVSFKIINSKKEPITFATISVTERTDSSKSIKKLSDSTGIVKFDLPGSGQYIVGITSVNYQPLEKGIIVSQAQSSFTFSLETLPKTLGGVVVTSSKPLMKQEDDKTIVDPENLAAASTNGYEVLEKTPGLFIDQDGNIYISSLRPATVQINGRDMKMSAADVATILKSLPPNSILKIEIIRTPSAKYDAESSGGIVNVVLKKGIKIGMTGGVNGGFQQGQYGNQFAGLNINNNNGRRSSLFSLNYNRRNTYERLVTDRTFKPDTVLSQDAYTKYASDAWFAQYVTTYTSGKWEVEFSGQESLTVSDNKTTSLNAIKKESTGGIISKNDNYVINHNNSLLIGVGIEPRLKIDSMGSEWDSNIFYYNSSNTSDQTFSTGDGNADNRRNLFTMKSDLKLVMKRRFTFETGVKSSIHNFRNGTDYFQESGGIRIKDEGRTNTFHYAENINAFYLQGSKTFGKNVILKVGTRIENTNMEGRQVIPHDTSFSIHRTDLFPYVYLSKNILNIAGFDLRAYLVYRRTITRPVYEQLNPFPRYVDAYLTEAGNPSLRPQFTQNYEANISVNEQPLLAIGINDTKDIFSSVVYTSPYDTTHAISYRTYDNLGKNKEWYLRGLGAIPPGKRYFFVVGAQYNHNFYDGVYENSPLSYKKGTWTFFTYHTFKIDKRSVITMNGFVRLKGQQGFYELGPFGALNASVNRKFLKDKLIITASANDIFFTNKNSFTIKQGSIDAHGTREADTRRFGINLRYNFGIRKKDEGTNMFNVESPEKSN